MLDASAVLAALFAEKRPTPSSWRSPGRLTLVAVNLAGQAQATRALDLGKPLEETTREIGRLPLHIAAYDAEQAYFTASLRPVARPLRRCRSATGPCLALAMTRKATGADRLRETGENWTWASTSSSSR